MVITLVCVVAAFVVFFQFVRPAYIEAQDVRAEVISRETFLEQQRAAVEQVQQLIDRYRADAQVQETVSRVLPSTPDVGGALYQISAIAQGFGIQVLSTTAQTPQLAIARPSGSASSTVGAVRPLGVATFQVKFASSYDNLKTFVERLENNVRLMDITAIAVTQAPGATALDVDMTVATYYQLTQ